MTEKSPEAPTDELCWQSIRDDGALMNFSGMTHIGKVIQVFRFCVIVKENPPKDAFQANGSVVEP